MSLVKDKQACRGEHAFKQNCIFGKRIRLLKHQQQGMFVRLAAIMLAISMVAAAGLAEAQGVSEPVLRALFPVAGL